MGTSCPHLQELLLLTGGGPRNSGLILAPNSQQLAVSTVSGPFSGVVGAVAAVGREESKVNTSPRGFLW